LLKLYLKDSLYNAGLLVFYRILKYNNKNFKIDKNFIEFDENIFLNFIKNYFLKFINILKNPDFCVD
jgi:hypothetical protein